MTVGLPAAARDVIGLAYEKGPVPTVPHPQPADRDTEQQRGGGADGEELASHGGRPAGILPAAGVFVGSASPSGRHRSVAVFWPRSVLSKQTALDRSAVIL